MKTITSKIKLIGGMLSLMIAAVVGITVYINQASRQDSVVINVAGKQRMLTQKITKEVFWLQTRDIQGFEELDASRKEFAASLKDLLHGNDSRGIYAPPKPCIDERLGQVASLWNTFDGYVGQYKELLIETDKLKTVFPEESERILQMSDSVVKKMVAEGLEGAYIDDSGRQRMLTQKIAFSATQYLMTGDSHFFTLFQNAYGLYDATLKGFVADDMIVQRERLYALLQENKNAWQHYSTYIVGLMEKQKRINETVLRIEELNVVLLDTMDSAVSAYSKYSEDQRDFLQLFQYAASLIAVLFMLYTVLLTLRIQKDFGAFLTQSRAMADSLPVEEETVKYMPNMEMVQKDELSQASMHMSQFLDKVNTILKHAEQAIHESEQAAKELASVNETMDERIDDLNLDEASRKDIDKTIDKSEDIVIQTLEELSSTSKLLGQLQKNLQTITEKTGKKDLS